MQIPERFKLLGHQIEVKYDPERYFERGAFGACSYEGKWIKLVPPGESHPISQTSLEHSFFHELLHLCIECTEQSQLNDNEKFVDTLAGLLHQAITTMEYGE